MSHPLRDLIAARRAQREADGIPVPRYMLAVSVSANSLTELHQRVDQLAVDFIVEWSEREHIESTDGMTSVLLDVTCADQTPERYTEQLQAWADARRTPTQPDGDTQ